MSEAIRCPSCSSALRVSEELLGREVKCPRCATVFTAVEDRPDPLAAAPREVDSPVRPMAVRRRDDDPDEREPPRFRRRDFDDEVDEDYDRWDVRQRRGRRYAEAR